MKKPVPKGHPLEDLFRELTVRNFMENLRLKDRDIIIYISDLLMEFTHSDNLYRLRDSAGYRLDSVAKMLLEWQEIKEKTGDMQTERNLRKHIGDYTLFFTGMFPEYLKKLKDSRRMDYFIDYIETGKESYFIVAESSSGIYEKDKLLYLKLSEYFDYCVVGLNFIRSDLDRIKNIEFGKIKKIIQS